MHKELISQLKNTLIYNGVCFIATLIFLFFGMYNVPLGFIFGTVVALLVKVIYYFLNKLDEKNKLNPWMIIINVLINLAVVILIATSIFVSLLLEHLGVNIFSWISVSFALLMAFGSLIYKKVVGGSK